MDQGFRLYNNGEATVITPELLQVIFDTLPTGIEMLRPIRDNNSQIVDFEWVLENETVRKAPGYVKRVGKKFLTENGNDHELFKKMSELAGSEKPTQGIALGDLFDNSHWFDVKFVKYGDTIIIFKDNTTTKKKLADKASGKMHIL